MKSVYVDIFSNISNLQFGFKPKHSGAMVSLTCKDMIDTILREIVMLIHTF